MRHIELLAGCRFGRLAPMQPGREPCGSGQGAGAAHLRAMAEAIGEQAKRLLNPLDFPTPERLSLARKLIEKTPPHLDKVIFMTTGAEAMDASLRMARKATGHYEIVSFWGGFHGRSYGPMSVTGLAKIKKHFGPMVPGTILAPYANCYRCPFDKTYPDCDLFCVDFLDRVVDTESAGYLAGMIVEPYQGTAGFVFPPPGYLKKLESWAARRGLVFILDEVQSSYGRTGKMWALEHEDLKPDILCLGKGIGSGAPISAVLGTTKVFSALSSGEMSSTMGGNPLCAAGTGMFLEQQAYRLGITMQDFARLALEFQGQPPRIAARCSVFAKSDMIHLQQIATPVADIVAGLCFAMARSIRSNLARGRPLEAPVVFQGGVAANAGMARALREVFELADGDSRLLGTLEATVPPGSLLQLDRVLRRVTGSDLGAASAILRPAVCGRPYLAYVSLVEGRTGDAVYLAAAPLGPP